MLTPRFYLKSDPRDDGQRLVIMFFFYRIGNAPVRFTYSTQVFVPDDRWSKKKQRIKPSQAYRQATEKNAVLNWMAGECETIYYRYLRTGRLSELSRDRFREEMDLAMNRSQATTDLIEYAVELIDRREAAGTKPGTLKSYRTTIGHLQKYAESINVKDWRLEEIDVRWSEGFQEYLFGTGAQINHVHNILKRVRYFVNQAIREGLTENTTVQSRDFQVTPTQTDEVYLSVGEIRKIRDAVVEPELEPIRDTFVVACFTGVRISDTNKLDLDIQIDGNRPILRFQTQKTGETVSVPLSPTALQVLERYGGSLPSYSDQYFNRSIKEICKAAGITNKVRKLNTSGGQKKYEVWEKWKLVSSHTARRSFATNAYLAGLDLIVISKITGHTTTKALMDYIKASDIDLANKAAKNPFFDF